MKRKRTRTTEITFERSEVFVVGKSGKQTYAWCSQCNARASMLTPERAAQAAGVGTRAIYNWVETGQVHFIETSDGTLFICRTSFPASGRE